MVVWAEDHDETTEGFRLLGWAIRYVPGVGWGEAELIDADTPSATGSFDVAVDAGGKAIVVWSNEHDVQWNYWAAHSGRPE